MASVRGTHQVVFALREHGQDMERELQSELHAWAGRAAVLMKRMAAKGASGELVDSIREEQIDPNTWEVKPNTAHAPYVERGIKPGGKGLPRYMDPASNSILMWLERTAFRGQPRVRKGTGKYTARELELRDRYKGLAWHVRHFGVKAQPFVEPTAVAIEPKFQHGMGLAVRRVLAARPDAGGDMGGAVA